MTAIDGVRAQRTTIRAVAAESNRLSADSGVSSPIAGMASSGACCSSGWGTSSSASSPIVGLAGISSPPSAAGAANPPVETAGAGVSSIVGVMIPSSVRARLSRPRLITV